MPIFDKLTNAAKEFFIESDDEAAAPSTTPPTVPYGAASQPAAAAPTATFNAAPVTQAALASYELANSAALADLQSHRKAAETFLNASGGAK